MKLSSREMTILAVFLSVAILVAGAFLFILPEYERIEPNRNALQAAKDEKAQIYASLERENTIDQEIQEAIDLANTISLYFYEDMTAYDADVVIREILEATNMSADSLSLGNYTTSTLTVSDYAETVVSYPLKEYSGYKEGILDAANYSMEYDESGRLIVPQDYVDKYGDQALTEFLTAKLSTQSQTVGAITATFVVKGTRSDFLSFLDYIAGLERATIINSVSVDYTGGASADDAPASTTTASPAAPAESEGAEEAEGAEGAEGQEESEATAAPAPAAAADASSTVQQLTDNSQVSVSISLTMYCVTPMQAQETTASETEPEPAE